MTRKELVELKKNEPRTSSIELYQGFKLAEHRLVVRLIKKYQSDFEEFGVLVTVLRKPTDKGGRPIVEYWLNYQQSMYLGTLLQNSETVRKFKKKLVKEFTRLTKVVNQIAANQQNAEWLEKRKLGKVSRLIETDEIKRFVEYAEKNGSKNAKRYYGLITTAENKALFFLEQKFKNVREVLHGHQLETISNADRIISKQLKKCVDEGLDYHKGYYMAKEAVETFAELIGKTLVPMLDQKQLN
jgi:phage regulator Rha-like protein